MAEYDSERRNSDERAGIYSDEGREDLIEKEDEITDVDEGFMKGYNDYSESTQCKNCKKTLEGHEVIEREFKDEVCRFCSQHCLTEFEINNQEEE